MEKKVLTLILSLFAVQAFSQTQNIDVVEYCPAPGQFVNMLPSASATTTYQDICSSFIQISDKLKNRNHQIKQNNRYYSYYPQSPVHIFINSYKPSYILFIQHKYPSSMFSSAL